MLTDCLFSISQFTNIFTTLNCLKTSKTMSQINTEYFWRLLCERDYKKHFIPDNFYQTYKYYYQVSKSKFKYGRMYQLIIDKSKKIPMQKDRKYDILNYIRRKTKHEIINEANEIVQHHNTHKSISKKYNEFADLNINEPIEFHNDFYLGRCVQFILDTNNKIELSDIITKIKKDILDLAHTMKARILAPSEGTDFDVDCEDCGTWSYGDKRCACGDRRYHLYCPDIVSSLDYTDIDSYPEHY